MKTPECKVHFNSLMEKLEGTKRSQSKMLKEVLSLHQSEGFGQCKTCVEFRANGPRRLNYPCKTIKIIERRLK